MIKPVFKHSKVVYAISAILTIPLLIDICTACHLIPLWIAWILFTLICGISAVRLWFGFSQKCYKFSFGLIGQLLLGGAVLTFFQLSYTNVIETPVSHPITPAVVDIAPPIISHDSIPKTAERYPDHRTDVDNSKVMDKVEKTEEQKEQKALK